MDGSLIEAWASLKSFGPKDEKKEPPDDKGNPTVNFHGQKRGNTTHVSTTDPKAPLAYSLNDVMENRNGLLVDLAVMPADGFAKRDSVVMMLEGLKSRSERSSVGADKGYDTEDFVADCRRMGVRPHIAQTTDTRRRSAIDPRTTRPAVTPSASGHGSESKRVGAG